MELQQSCFIGDAFSIGCQHGLKFADQIIPRVESLWKNIGSRRWKILDIIIKTQKLIDSICPEINLEIEGISKTTQLPFEQVFLYNNRDIIGFFESDFCSHFYIKSDDTVIVGMNKDAPVNFLDMYFLKTVYPAKGYSFIGYGHVGRVWGHGMNEKGLVTAGTAAYPKDKGETAVALGLYLIPPMVLSKCETVSEALDLIESIKNLSGGGNFLFADRLGNSVVLEISPTQRILRQPKDNILYSSNFYASGNIMHDDSPERLQESHRRFEALGKILCQQQGTAMEKAITALRFHSEEVSICRHNVFGFNTMLSYLALPGTNSFYISSGFPCENEYIVHKL